MTDLKGQGVQIQELLGLRFPPVAIAFRASAPPGMRRIDSPAPAGCGYWRRAADGEVFYTEAPDHYTCPVGAHTHGIDLPPDVAEQLNGLVQTMVQMQYISMDEIPRIPRRQGAFGVALYAPLTGAPFEPDVVLVRGNVKQLMLLAEAAQGSISLGYGVIVLAVWRQFGDRAGRGAVGPKLFARQPALTIKRSRARFTPATPATPANGAGAGRRGSRW